MGITVKQLLKFCDEQVKKGNGDKEIKLDIDNKEIQEEYLRERE